MTSGPAFIPRCYTSLVVFLLSFLVFTFISEHVSANSHNQGALENFANVKPVYTAWNYKRNDKQTYPNQNSDFLVSLNLKRQDSSKIPNSVTSVGRTVNSNQEIATPTSAPSGSKQNTQTVVQSTSYSKTNSVKPSETQTSSDSDSSSDNGDGNSDSSDSSDSSSDDQTEQSVSTDYALPSITPYVVRPTGYVLSSGNRPFNIYSNVIVMVIGTVMVSSLLYF
ncbi:hypothetical protein BB559_000271 [Furculomyces boomerangus]|uniref:Uncharacterized protein n=1 Tax=Furculomyces boomerangus TaxID=61424 RepID=A0A2T9Z5U9_9FUNG|nr:hypothetical protein BB559_000271 [Furculomyces boomerangus]